MGEKGVEQIAAEVAFCAVSWEREARLLGNVTAAELFTLAAWPVRLQRARARNLVERLRTMVVVLAWRLSERRCADRFVTAARAVRLTERANRIEAKYLKEGT